MSVVAEALRVRVIPGLAVDGVDERGLGSRKARAVLRALGIARGRPVSHGRLAEVVWGDEQPQDPPAQLAVLVSRLRRVVGVSRITHGDLGYALATDWLDIDAAAELAAEAERRLSTGSPAAALAAAQSAQTLVAHPELDDPVWPEEERRAVERLAAQTRRLVARAALAAGDLATGVEAAERALDADGYDEIALRLAMAGLTAQGRASSALALYERVRERLSDELGVSPSAETIVAHLAVLKGEPVPAITVAPLAESRAVGVGIAGRDGELRALDAAFARVTRGAPAAVVIVGEPGIGKTALAQAWIGSLDPAVTVLATRCDQLSRALPLQAVLRLVRDHLRRAGADAARSLLGDDAPFLEPLLSSGADTAVSPDAALALTSSPAGLALLIAALHRVALRACASPSVVFVDDAHRADPLTVVWLAELATAPGAPLFLLLTQRDGETSAVKAATVLELGPVSVDAAAEIVGRERAAALHRRSGGNPLFLTALASTRAGTSVPSSVQAAVVERCAEAGSAGDVIRAAALLGPRIDVDLLATVLRADPIRVLEDLEQGVRLGLIGEREGGFVLRHEITREALEASLTAPRRALLHRAAARALIARGGADPLDVADHARLSGAREIASQALTEGSRLAAARFDLATALTLATEAVTAADTTDARLQRATVLLQQTHYEQARIDAETAVERGDSVRALEVAGAVAYYCCDFERALALGSALVERAGDATERVQGHVIATRALHAAGDVGAAATELRRALRVCRDNGVPRPVSIVMFLDVHMGRADTAVRAMRASAESVGAQEATIYTPVHTLLAFGYALATSGRAGAAMSVLERALADAGRRGLDRYAVSASNITAWVQRNLGDVEAARMANAAARDGARASSHRELEVYATLDPCDDALAAGDAATARACLDEGRALMTSVYAYRWRHELRVRLLEGRIALVEGAAQRGLECAQTLIAEAGTRLAPRYERLGEVLRWSCLARIGAAPPEPRVLDELSGALSGVAGVEAWWLLGDLARELGSSRCMDLAHEQRDRLAAALPPERRERFLDYAGTRLESTSTRGRTA